MGFGVEKFLNRDRGCHPLTDTRADDLVEAAGSHWMHAVLNQGNWKSICIRLVMIMMV